MQKQSKKQDIELAALLFLVGLLLFFYPVVTQVASYQADEEAYAELAMEYMPPEISPEAGLPIPKRTEAPTDEPSQAEKPVTASDCLEAAQEDEGCDVTEAADMQPASPAPSGKPAGAEVLEETETPEKPADEITALPAVAETASPAKTPFAPTAQPAQNGSAIDLNACLAQNRDFVAWLSIPGTKINYPVVRSDNSEYYLHHLFTGKESKLGCLFSLKSSDYETPSKNIAIYGHHLSHSDAMFSTLVEYKDAAYCASHSQIRLSSLYGERTYRIFAVLNMKVSDWDAATASFSSEDDFLRFVQRAAKKSLVDTGVQVTAEDSILTLITCDRSYGGASGRLLVMAVQE
ncbi:MAG: sortase [Clostridia bacterium]|nr:sortase [Clostridia bacterium]